ncbi:MAG: hypothetical protein JNJ99_05300 [Crocinitomicaceae bacterium]|nr:hypothetical protein [Crocinitomicaceae bacterium]
MKNVLSVFLLFISVELSAQNKNLDFAHALKVSNGIHLDYASGYTLYNGNPATINWAHWNFIKPSIAYVRSTKKSNFHEFELNEINLNHHDSKPIQITDTSGNIQSVPFGVNNIVGAISLRYSYVLNLIRKKDQKIVPAIGFGINPFYSFIKYKPNTSSVFPSSKNEIGIHGFLTPQLTWFVKPRLFTTLSIPLCLFTGSAERNKYQNPALSADYQTTITSDFETLPKSFSLRIGIGLKLQ